MKVVGEREIFASLVELKHHLITETIRNENEDKKTNAKALDLTRKKEDIKLQTISAMAASAALIFLQCVDLV